MGKYKRTDSDLLVPSKKNFVIPDWMFFQNEMQEINIGDQVINLQKEYPHSEYGRKGTVVDFGILNEGQIVLTVKLDGEVYQPHQKGHSFFLGSVIKIPTT